MSLCVCLSVSVSLGERERETGRERDGLKQVKDTAEEKVKKHDE